jgi:DNA-binding transcriptional regulator WhiA
MLNVTDRLTTAYVVGIAMGDGNLSNPNGRAVRLRITCDTKYPKLISKIEKNIKKIAPNNKVSRVMRADNAIDISCYSNDWENILGWKSNGGSKMKQKISTPLWIINNKSYSQACLCGLFETDGSIYKDRKYLTVNFVTQIPNLAKSVEIMLDMFNYKYSCQKFKLDNGKIKYTFRIHKNASGFIEMLGLEKN